MTVQASLFRTCSETTSLVYNITDEGAFNLDRDDKSSTMNIFQTIEQLEEEMLNGQKLQGPPTAAEVNYMLKSIGKEDR